MEAMVNPVTEKKPKINKKIKKMATKNVCLIVIYTFWEHQQYSTQHYV